MDSQYRAAFLATLRTGQFAGRDELETSNSVLRKTIPAFTGTSKSTIEMLTYWRQVVRMKEFYRVGNPDDHIEFYNTKRALGDVLSSYMDGYRLLFPGDLGVPLWFIDLSMDLETWIDIFRDDIFRDRTRSNFALNPALPK